jgi:hypothetical protein
MPHRKSVVIAPSKDELDVGQGWIGSMETYKANFKYQSKDMLRQSYQNSSSRAATQQPYSRKMSPQQHQKQRQQEQAMLTLNL